MELVRTSMKRFTNIQLTKATMELGGVESV